MPSINDIVGIAEALEKSPVAVVADRCLKVRNRNASCRKCRDACPVDAIEVAANEISLDASACMACGACTAVCPNEALVSLRPLDAQLAADAARAAAENEGRAVFACARMAAKRVGDPSRFAEVPCLARMEESVVLSLVSHGATDVVLVDGTCGTCRYGACSAGVERTVECVNDLLAAHGSDVRAARASEFPPEVLADRADGLYGSTRRGFFSEAAGAAKDTALTAARTTIQQELGYSQEKPKIGERLRVGKSGQMPQLSMARHEVAINALDALGGPTEPAVRTRLFGTVSIDLDKCNACGMCTVFCSTGALRRDPVERMSEPLRYLEFLACDCVQCGMCADVCWKGALKVSGLVPTDELFSFEPRTFPMQAPSEKPRFGRA